MKNIEVEIKQELFEDEENEIFHGVPLKSDKSYKESDSDFIDELLLDVKKMNRLQKEIFKGEMMELIISDDF